MYPMHRWYESLQWISACSTERFSANKTEIFTPVSAYRRLKREQYIYIFIFLSIYIHTHISYLSFQSSNKGMVITASPYVELPPFLMFSTQVVQVVNGHWYIVLQNTKFISRSLLGLSCLQNRLMTNMVCLQLYHVDYFIYLKILCCPYLLYHDSCNHWSFCCLLSFVIFSKTKLGVTGGLFSTTNMLFTSISIHGLMTNFFSVLYSISLCKYATNDLSTPLWKGILVNYILYSYE